jgi:hypothetical protein
MRINNRPSRRGWPGLIDSVGHGSAKINFICDRGELSELPMCHEGLKLDYKSHG